MSDSSLSNRRAREDIALFTFMTGGLILPYIIGVYVYVYGRAFVRRFIKRMPDWEEF